MRLFRWAAELAVSNDERKRVAGVAALAALDEAGLFEGDDLVLIGTVTDAVAANAEAEYRQPPEGEGHNDDESD
jgi:hypothetical protein